METSWINKINPNHLVDASHGIKLIANGNDSMKGIDPHIWLDPVTCKTAS